MILTNQRKNNHKKKTKKWTDKSKKGKEIEDI